MRTHLNPKTTALALVGILTLAAVAVAAVEWIPDGGGPQLPSSGSYTGTVTFASGSPGVYTLTQSSPAGVLNITDDDPTLSSGMKDALDRAVWEGDSNNTVNLTVSGPDVTIDAVTNGSAGDHLGYVEYSSSDAAGGPAYYWVRDLAGTVLTIFREVDPSMTPPMVAQMDLALRNPTGSSVVSIDPEGAVIGVTP